MDTFDTDSEPFVSATPHRTANRRKFISGLVGGAAIMAPAIRVLAEAPPAFASSSGAGMAVVYSNDCPSALKRVPADGVTVFQCTGTADQTTINNAINAV